MTNETKQAYAILLTTILGVPTVHFLFLEYPYGWPLAVFVVFLALSLVLVRSFSPRPVNAWAYAFLPPAWLIALAHLLYANSVLRSYGWLIAAASLALFAYWLFAPKISMKQAMSFWPNDLVPETLFPVGHGSWLRGLSFHKDSKQALIGLAIAIPAIFVFLGLFMSADALVSKVLGDAFRFDDPAWFLFKTIFDIAFVAYFSHFLWTALTRSTHDRHPKWSEWRAQDFSVAFTTFLAVINLLFLGFIAFQFVYFFGGQAVVEAHGLTYASYAREGFFQLFTVSVLVFGLLFGIAWHTRLRSLAVRLLSLGLILQSWIVIASAIKRLTLYVDAYGLSVLRFWALAGLVVVALGLFVLATSLVTKSRFESLTKALSLATLYIFAGLLLVNVEGAVVRWNASRLLTENVAPDLLYPYTLSSDAVPAHVAWLKDRSETEKLDCYSIWIDMTKKYPYEYGLEEGGQKREIASRSLDAIAATKGRPSIFFGNQALQRSEACDVGVWKEYLRTTEVSFLRERLSDPRAWTLSGARALEALESLE
jgi:hypothetical protein